jgi:DNA polymerase III gamma/tau subunit
MLDGAMADAETLKRQSQLFTPDQFSYMIVLLREAKLRARRDTTGRIAIELAILKMCRLSDLVPIQEALEELSGGPGPARGADRPPASGAAAAEAGQGPVGRIRNIKERLKSGRKADPLATAERKVPEGMDEVKYRQVAAAAESPEVGREALKKEALLKAFGDADKALGLSPQRLERLQRREKAEEPEAEAEAGEEQAE